MVNYIVFLLMIIQIFFIGTMTEGGEQLVETQRKLHRKDNRLLGMLQSIHVDSTDPLPKVSVCRYIQLARIQL